jgi:phosphoserine phosphatase RsbU/P
MADFQAISQSRMRELLDVSRELAVTNDLDKLLPLICASATRMLSADRCSLFLYDKPNDQLWTKVALGAGEIRVPSHAGIVGLVFQTRQPLVIPDAYADNRFNRGVDQKTGYHTRNLLTLPVFDRDGHAVAVLQVINKLPDGTDSTTDFTESDQMLAQLLADQVGVAIQRYHLEQKAEEAAAMEREMDLARRVQERLIPKTPPRVAGWVTAGWNRPASTTGGDAYDLWRTSDGRLGVFLADATGHGIAPALVVSQTRALVRVLTDDAFDPAQILARVNKRLSADLEMGMFVTAFLGLLDADGELKWCSAGHGPILVRTGPDADVIELAPPAPPLGVIEDFEPDLAPPVQIAIGGGLVVVSDGITESWSPERELFGQERFTETLPGLWTSNPADWIKTVQSTLLAWQREREPSDDQTIVVAVRR